MEAGEANSKYLTFRLSGDRYGITVRSIQEILEVPRITKIPRSERYILGVMNVRGRVVPVVDLRVKLELPAREKSIDSAILVLEPGGGSDTIIGVLVDAVEEVLSIGAESIQPAPKLGTTVESRVLSGMGRIEDAFVILLNPDAIFSQEEIAIA